MSFTETCTATIDHQPPWLVWDWTMVSFAISVVLLVMLYAFRKVKILITVIDDVDERPYPSREEPPAPRARLGRRPNTFFGGAVTFALGFGQFVRAQHPGGYPRTPY